MAEKKIPFELVTEVPWDRNTVTPRYNPLEKLPILLLDDGSSIYESRFILEFLELKHPRPRLLPDDVDGIIAARRLEVLADGVCDALVLTFWERRRPEAHQSQEWLARQRRKVDGGLAEIARLVGDGQWAMGDDFGLGDIAVGSLVGFLTVRFPEIAWRELYPGLAALSDRLEARSSFRSSVPVPQTISDAVV